MSTMYRFSWRDLVVEPFTAELASIAGLDEKSLPDDTSTLLSQIFHGVGGIPTARADWDEATRARVAGRLLGEASSALLRRVYHFGNRQSAAVAQRQGGARVAVSIASVDVNRATRQELEDLPVIGPELALRVLKERRQNGRFDSLSNLIERVAGLGTATGEQLAAALTISDEPATFTPRVAGNLRDDLAALIRLHDAGNAPARLLLTLEDLAMFVAAHPHPCTRAGKKREDLEDAATWVPLEPAVRASSVKIFADRTYYHELLEALGTATRSIDVCMFYIALPKPDHPTRALLNALVSSAAKGVSVRVLVDQDGKRDPYGSRLINAEAVRFLASHGVQVLGDATESLLHSKFVVIDDALVVIGSHNWTAGSFFQYSDLSVAIAGSAPNQLWSRRFEELWANAKPFVLADST